MTSAGLYFGATNRSGWIAQSRNNLDSSTNHEKTSQPRFGTGKLIAGLKQKKIKLGVPQDGALGPLPHIFQFSIHFFLMAQ